MRFNRHGIYFLSTNKRIHYGYYSHLCKQPTQKTRQENYREVGFGKSPRYLSGGFLWWLQKAKKSCTFGLSICEITPSGMVDIYTCYGFLANMRNALNKKCCFLQLSYSIDKLC
jgi:hypothetical protein